MHKIFQGRGRGVLALFVIWALFGQHVFVHHLGGSDLDLPFNAITWLFVGSVFIAGAIALKPVRVSSELGRYFFLAALVLWLPWLFTLLADFSSSTVNLQAVYWQALPRLLALTAGVLLFWILQQCRFNAQQRHFLLCTLLMLATVQISFGLVQFFFLLADNWFLFNTKVRFPYGIFMQRNVMSSFVGSGVLLALYLLVRRSNGEWRGLWWLWCSTVAVAGLVLVVLLQSRAGLYSLLVGLCLLLPVCWLRLTSRVQRGVLIALVVCGTGAGLALLLHFDMHRRALAVYGELGVRYEIWQTTLGLVVQHIWLGVGYGNFESAYYAEAGRLLALSGAVPAMPGDLHHPHNEVLMWWVEGGVITLLAWALLAWGILGVWLRLSAGERLAMLALCLPLFAHLMSEYPLGHSSVHWIWLLLVLWYFDSQVAASEELNCAGEELRVKSDRRSVKEKTTSAGGRSLVVVRVGLVLVGGVMVLYMATGLQTVYQLTEYQRGHFSEPERLTQTWNPWFWADRQALYRHSLALEKAIKEQDQAAIAEYLVWSEPVITRLPRTTLLHNHIVALLAAGRDAQVASFVLRLQLEYPQQSLFKTQAIESLKSQLAIDEKVQIFHHLADPVGSAIDY
ncbi:Wzy polymerase domain-containing protein [Oceanisphaera sp. IT1-181]|uniref:Wzy polymerase domain-containing protein n=1 Tax=Oceanisphaera sp. IT1-181 TaxID=3081199 RepID=UPI0029C9C0D3|nr:Wzy polymerase domain-containing protein [Oceanisphaera sp. IT1-181]